MLLFSIICLALIICIMQHLLNWICRGVVQESYNEGAWIMVCMGAIVIVIVTIVAFKYEGIWIAQYLNQK